MFSINWEGALRTLVLLLNGLRTCSSSISVLGNITGERTGERTVLGAIPEQRSSSPTGSIGGVIIIDGSLVVIRCWRFLRN